MDYKETLNLPQTSFEMRANLPQREPVILKRWEKEELYARIISQGKGRPRFALHDGPPYANGHLHPGTVLNKVLKDIVVKYKTMNGYLCDFIPGWDCHGLPIEHQVDKDLGPKKKQLDQVAFRRECRKYAEKFVGIQRQEFQRLGVLGRWEKPYLTMNYSYQAEILREFQKVVRGGGIYREKKPVYWCTHCITALAEAEVEYQDQSTPSIAVRFPLVQGAGPLAGQEKNKTAVVIWTTTPWTLPANLAIAVHEKIEYALVESRGEQLVLAADRVEEVVRRGAKADYRLLKTFSGREIEGSLCRHPFVQRQVPVYRADFVTLETGTGCVHCAPGHGQEDYQFGLRHGLPAYCPVDSRGRFTEEVPQFAGRYVLEANGAVVELLRQQGALLWAETMTHSYPNCWRCKNPVLFRATSQWFLSMEKTGLRHKALQAIEAVQWIPKWGQDRIRGMVEVRPDWCLSRQRSWGIPLVAVVCDQCGLGKIDDRLLGAVIAATEKEGADVWFARDLADFGFTGGSCEGCGGRSWSKGQDILDVWFDSGVSYACVAEKEESLGLPVDLYLEGSDQHRGWFQSSLLQAVATRGQPPYKAVLTHGFVVDGAGKKMSKSLGNFMPPGELIKKYGVDVLRLWVAAEDYREDVRLSDEILARLVDTYRRIRNTARFLLGNLNDFDPARDAVPLAKRQELDRFMANRLARLLQRLDEAYAAYEFHKVVAAAHHFCVVDLSSFYLDILKDRLYTSAKKGALRRSSQSTLAEILETLAAVLAPVLAFTAEDIWQAIPWRQGGSVHLQPFPRAAAAAIDDALEKKWSRFLEVRAVALKALEEARAAKTIGHSLEAEVALKVPDQERTSFDSFASELADLLIVSKAGIEGGTSEIAASVKQAQGDKCPRCWRRQSDIGSDPAHPQVCGRCAATLRELK